MDGDGGMPGPPRNPRVGRQAVLVRFLRATIVVVALASLTELLVPPGLRHAAGVAMVSVIIAAPLARVVWLVVRWWRLGDRRFAAVGLALLLVVASSALLR